MGVDGDDHAIAARPLKFWNANRIIRSSVGGEERMSDAGTPGTGNPHRSGLGAPFAV
jgi:hypothetical protein